MPTPNPHIRGPWSIGDADQDLLPNHVYVDAPDHGAFAQVVIRMESAKWSPECEAKIVAVLAVPDLVSALRAMIAAATPGPEIFPGHNQAYLERVALPRAQAVLDRVDAGTL